jgi:hypothetical protein
MRPSICALTLVFLVAACSSSRTPSTTPSSRPPTTPSLEPPPLRTAVVDGVRLVPIAAAQRAECVKFADELHRPVPCPGLLPDPIPVSTTSPSASCLGTLGEGACGPAVIQVSTSFLLSQSNFQVPRGYLGVTFEQYSGAVVPEPSVDGGPLGHFVFTAEPGHATVPTYCSLTSARTVRVHGAIVMLYQCSNASGGPGELKLFQGHELLVWDDSGITCEVSFHGHSQVNVDLDIAVARATTQVSPSQH